MTNKNEHASLSDADRQTLADLSTEANKLAKRGSETGTTRQLEDANALMHAAEIMLTRRQGTRNTEDRIKLLQGRLHVMKKLRVTKEQRDHAETMVRLCNDIIVGQTEELIKTQSAKAEILCNLGWSNFDSNNEHCLVPRVQEYFHESLQTIILIEKHRRHQWLEWEKPGGNNRLAMAKLLMNRTSGGRGMLLGDLLSIFESEVNRLNNSGEAFVTADIEYERCRCYYELETIRQRGAVWTNPLERALNLLTAAPKPLPVNVSLLQAKLFLLRGKFYLQHIAIEGDETLFGKKTHAKEALIALRESMQIFQSVKDLSSAEATAGIEECEKLITSVSESNPHLIAKDNNEPETQWDCDKRR